MRNKKGQVFGKTALIAAVLIIIGAYMFSDITGGPSNRIDTYSAEIKEARYNFTLPSFEASDIHGAAVDTQRLDGKVVLVNIWASWCAPCVAEFPYLMTLARDNADDFVLLAISVDAEAKNMHRFIDRFARQEGAYPDNLIFMHDPEKRIAQDIFGTVNYPESFLFGKDGNLIGKYAGAIDTLPEEDFEAVLEAALSAEE